ncbi:MAG TPA: M48 family metallopeptidase [Bryobacteraceae bacterium]|nr:M48 family metallopeptidase [Bryobacteraceae bacterium]
MHRFRHFVLILSCTAPLLWSAREPGSALRPGWNMFNKEQDVQLGQEAAAEVRKKSQVVQNQFLQSYISRVGQRIAGASEARASGFTFTFTLIADPSINAFALPGGPMFINTGLLAAVDNEAELAGVIGHEISHVILRHGTHEASKANLIELPAALAGSLAGSSGSLLGKLAQLGIGFGANSVLLRFSRDAESEADALGSHLMAEAGYNPVEMAHFFEKMQSSGPSNGPQFLSDHPNPGNREAAIEAEVRTLPQRKYGYETGDFRRAKAQLARLPKPAVKPAGARGGML